MDAEPLYPTVRLKAGVAECYHKTCGGELCSCPVGAEGGEEKMAIVFFGGAKGDRCTKEAVQATANELAGRYEIHEELVDFVVEFDRVMGLETTDEGEAALSALEAACRDLLTRVRPGGRVLGPA